MPRRARQLQLRTREQELDRVWKFYNELHGQEQRSNMAKAALWFGAPVLALIAISIYISNIL